MVTMTLCILGQEKTESNLRLLEASAPETPRILLDTLNPVLWGHRVSAMVEGLFRHLCGQIHAKDGVGCRMGVAILGNAPLNTGQADMSDTATALRAQGFGGYVISENDYGRLGESTAKHDITTLGELFLPE